MRIPLRFGLIGPKLPHRMPWPSLILTLSQIPLRKAVEVSFGKNVDN